jgi:diphthine-ammonia ligase
MATNKLSKTTPYFVSWSGGKDSCLSLYRAIKIYDKPICLFNMLTEDNLRSRSHGLLKSVLERQAGLLHIPIQFCASSWNNYETLFLKVLHDFKQNGIDMGVFGDIKILDNPNGSLQRKWADETCSKANIIAYEPLWDDDVHHLLREFFDLDFKAKIIAVKADRLSSDYLGRILDENLIEELVKQGIDPAGENGEYHTIVIDGPIFTEPLYVEERGRVLLDGYWFLDIY